MNAERKWTILIRNWSLTISQLSIHFKERLEGKLNTLLDELISIWFQKDTEPFEVKLLADKSATKYFKRRPLPTQTMGFSIKITHEMEILPIIKYWIPYIFVLEPELIREIIQEDLEIYTQKMCEFK